MYVLQKVTITLFQILFVAATYEKTNVISRACAGNWPSPLCEAATNCAVWSPPCESADAAAISIMFLDTLCSKKWYDMPHIGCGIHSLQ